MQVGIDVKYIHTNFGGQDFSGFGDTATFKNGQIHVVQVYAMHTICTCR